jgi:carboxylesterase
MDFIFFIFLTFTLHREATFLQKRVFHYAKGYKQLEGKNEEQINLEMKRLLNISIDSLVEFQQLIV